MSRRGGGPQVAGPEQCRAEVVESRGIGWSEFPGLRGRLRGLAAAAAAEEAGNSPGHRAQYETLGSTFYRCVETVLRFSRKVVALQRLCSA